MYQTLTAESTSENCFKKMTSEENRAVSIFNYHLQIAKTNFSTSLLGDTKQEIKGNFVESERKREIPQIIGRHVDALLVSLWQFPA